MELILLRHGTAEDFHPAGDFSRELTPTGRAEARNAGLTLQATGQLPEIVLTSPLARARQTAEEFCKAAEMEAPVMQDWLASGMHPEAGAKELVGFSNYERVMLVGHEPDFSQLTAWLLGAPNAHIQFRKGGLAALEISPPSRNATLLYLLPPKFTGGLA